MDKNGYSEEPWEVSYTSNYMGCEDFIKEFGHAVIKMPAPPFVLGRAGAIITNDCGRDEAEANARLICAAPKLLKALESILKSMESRSYDCNKDQIEWCKNKARAAIIEAKMR